MEIISKHQGLIDWLAKEKDEHVLNQIQNIKHRVTFNFEEAFAKGITSVELKEKNNSIFKIFTLEGINILYSDGVNNNLNRLSLILF